MIKWLKSYLVPKSNSSEGETTPPDTIPSDAGSDKPFIWCLVGNITGKRLTSTGEKAYGTKHFSSNTKVFCFPVLWGDGYENIKVIGRHRKSRRSICLIMPSKFITNWRLSKVYHPHIITIMKKEGGWTDSIQHKENALLLLHSLKSRL